MADILSIPGRVDIYHTFIKDHEADIIENLNINQIMRHFPHKEAISADDFTKISHASSGPAKSRIFIRRLLKRRKECELEAFVDLVTKYKDKDFLLVYLHRRLADGITSQSKNEYAGTHRADSISVAETQRTKASETPTEVVSRKRSSSKDKTIIDLCHKLTDTKVKLEDAKREISSKDSASITRLEAGRKELETEVKTLQKEVSDLRQNDQSGKITVLEREVNELKEQIEFLKKKQKSCSIS